MTSAETPSFEQVLILARQLRSADKLRLIAQLAPELTATLADERSDTAWDELFHMSGGEELPPTGKDSADVLSAMRR
jgi:hypothetical protein